MVKDALTSTHVGLTSVMAVTPSFFLARSAETLAPFESPVGFLSAFSSTSNAATSSSHQCLVQQDVVLPAYPRKHLVNAHGCLQFNKPGSKRIMSLNSSDTLDEQRRLGRVSEPVVRDGNVNGLLGCHTGLARTTTQRKQNSSYWLRATTLYREVCI
jgi:hypothetical protein